MDEGYESYQKALSFDPNFARAHWESANLELMTANTIYVEPDSWVWSGNARNRYIEHVEAAIETSPDEVDRTLYKAASELADLRYLESVRLLRRYLEDRPNDMDGWHSLLEQARIAGRYDRSVHGQCWVRPSWLSSIWPPLVLNSQMSRPRSTRLAAWKRN